MPSNRHSYMVLAIVCVCALAICAFLSWQNREKKNRLAQQYAEFSMPQTLKGSTPAQQKALPGGKRFFLGSGAEVLPPVDGAGKSEKYFSVLR